MSFDYSEVRVRGNITKVPSIRINGATIVVTGKWIKVAAVRNDQLVEGSVVGDPAILISELKACEPRADIFTFPQKVYEKTPKYQFPFEWNEAAAVCTEDFAAWWNKLPQEARKNTRRAAKKGVSIHVAKFDDEFVKGMKAIYDESPVRQGKRFYHFGKDPATIKKEQGEYIERSEFLGAYHQDELIGFIKLVYVDRVAKIMQILAKNAHYDKRPMNALISKAVEVCNKKGISYLIYGNFSYGNKVMSPLAEFKVRNGFEPMPFPRYYVPLTLKGSLALKIKLHRGLIGMLPSGLINLLLRVRSVFVGIRSRRFVSSSERGSAGEENRSLRRAHRWKLTVWYL
jgi:hypothetical protein